MELDHSSWFHIDPTRLGLTPRAFASFAVICNLNNSSAMLLITGCVSLIKHLCSTFINLWILCYVFVSGEPIDFSINVMCLQLFSYHLIGMFLLSKERIKSSLSVFIQSPFSYTNRDHKSLGNITVELHCNLLLEYSKSFPLKKCRNYHPDWQRMDRLIGNLLECQSELPVN